MSTTFATDVKTTAIYMRLSDDDGKISESDSIKSQRDLLLDYVQNNDFLATTKVLEFCDDGITGTHFNRPQVKRMLELVRSGQIQCVIVKDFSRFGRSYLEVGDYLEQVFPFLGVQFISVNDHYNNKENVGGVGSIDIAFKTLMHDFYSKDLSRKVTSSMQSQMKKGEYLSSDGFFGYTKPKNSKTLVVDEEASQIVKRIFALFLSGQTTVEIARLLNTENVPTPSNYKTMNNCKRVWKKVADVNFWKDAAVCRILNDERYTGKAICGKFRRVEVGSTKVKSVPKEEWFVTENKHEAIISAEMFQQASRLLKYSTAMDGDKKQRLLFGKVRCHCCNFAMHRSPSHVPYYFCKTTKYIESPNCVQGKISESTIEETLLLAIQHQFNLLFDNQKAKKALQKQSKNSTANNMETLKQLQKSLENLRLSKLTEYERYTEGKVGKIDYIQKKSEVDNQICLLEKKIELLEQEISQHENATTNTKLSPLLEKVKHGEFVTTLTKELLDELVQSVIIYDAENVEIVWKYADFYS